MVMDPSTVESAADESSSPRAAESAAADFHDLQKRLEEVGRYLGYLFTLRRERFTRSARRTLWLVIAALMGLTIAITLLVAGAVLLSVGISFAINRAFDSYWIGPLATGAGLITLLVGGFLLAIRAIEKKAARTLQHKHEVELAELKLRYGRGFDE